MRFQAGKRVQPVVRVWKQIVAKQIGIITSNCNIVRLKSRCIAPIIRYTPHTISIRSVPHTVARNPCVCPPPLNCTFPSALTHTRTCKGVGGGYISEFEKWISLLVICEDAFCSEFEMKWIWHKKLDRFPSEFGSEFENIYPDRILFLRALRARSALSRTPVMLATIPRLME